MAQPSVTKSVRLTVGLLLAAALIGLGQVQAGASTRPAPVAGEREQLPDKTELLTDERRELNEEMFDEIVKDFGQHISDVMTGEMDELISDVELEERKASERKQPKTETTNKPHHQVDHEQLDQLKSANKIVSKDIRARIELAADKNGANLPQAGFGMQKVTSFLSQASGRLSSAGDFIGQKMNAMGGIIKGVPTKLRNLMRWPDFLQFKVKFNKNYKSLREELYRHMIYLRTQTIVGVQRFKFLLRRQTYILQSTQFADMTSKEFHEITHNPMAEGPLEAIASDSNKMTPQLRASLQQLAKEGKNIFGLPVPVRQTGGGGAEKRRRKRSPEPMEIDSRDLSELDDEDETFGDASEEPEEVFVDALEDDPMETDEGERGADEDDGEAADTKLIDQYAAEFAGKLNEDSLDELSSIMDEALEPEKDFEPIDLRDTGCIIRPENQENCGCCYAHAATTAAVYYNCMASASEKSQRKAQRYHARFTASCGRYLVPEGENPPVRGCRGGLVSKAVAFIREAGVMPFMDYEFSRVSSRTFDSDQCAYARPEKLEGFGKIKVPFYRQATFSNIDISEVDLHLRTIGPVFVNMRHWQDFEHYGSGIVSGFKDSETLKTIHSMLIIGHDRDSLGKDYWIILDSHGTPWGERGFLRIYTDSLLYFKSYLAGLVPNEILTERKS